MGDEVLFVDAEIWNVATATVPLGTSAGGLLKLTMRQLALLALVEHEGISPEMEVTAELKATLTELKSAELEFIVHPAPVA